MFGDFFVYVVAANATMHLLMILTKLTVGIASIILAVLVTRQNTKIK